MSATYLGYFIVALLIGCGTPVQAGINSLLGKTLGCVSIKNETHFKLKPEEQYDYPFLAVRRHGHGLKDSTKFIINYKKQYDEPAYFEDKNNV